MVGVGGLKGGASQAGGQEYTMLTGERRTYVTSSALRTLEEAFKGRWRCDEGVKA